MFVTFSRASAVLNEMRACGQRGLKHHFSTCLCLLNRCIDKVLACLLLNHRGVFEVIKSPSLLHLHQLSENKLQGEIITALLFIYLANCVAIVNYTCRKALSLFSLFLFC